MATKYAIATVYKLIDNITMPLNKIGIKGKTVGRTLKNEFTKTQQQLANIGSKLKTFASGAALVGVGAIGAGLGVATKQFIDYDAAVTGATAKFKDLHALTRILKTLKLRQILNLAEGLNDKRIAIRALACQI